jgi:DNA excision repair protein ERCC-2
MKKVSIAVSDFALPAPRKGSIDIYSGFSRGAETGLEIHQQVQEQRLKDHSNYEAEVMTGHFFEAGGFKFDVQGRMDGVLSPTEDQPRAKIEEIKSTFNIFELGRKIKATPTEHPYCLQLKTYGYFHWLKTKEIPDLVLHLVSSRDGDTYDIDVKLNIDEYEAWLEIRLVELVEEAKIAEKRAKRRRKAAESFAFPFEKPRSGQVELIATIVSGMEENRPMLIQAPTGLGKTVGVLYPTLREAMARGQRVIYVTPKNSQHSVAEDAVERLQDKGANIKSMTITAKSKMCFKNEPICNPDFCEYAKDHYTKVAANKLVEQLAKKRSLKAKAIKKMAEEHQVCPFELQIDAAQEADAIICDYNYVFAPRSVLSRFSGLSIDQQGQPNLVIDEAHNLPSRAMDYYSPSLSSYTLEQMREEIKRLPVKFRSDAIDLLDQCIAVVRKCGPAKCEKPMKIRPPVEEFLKQDSELRSFLSSYLKADVDIQPRDVVLRLSFYWSEFTDALEFVMSGREEFFTTFDPNPASVTISCCDASKMLKSSYENYDQVVAFSATLKPFEYYSQLAGLKSKELKVAEFTSPFPEKNRKLLIIPQISSKYSEREKNYPRIAETIQKISTLKNGNYVAFFPSFDFLERVLTVFSPPAGFEVLKQERRMHADDIAYVLNELSESSAPQILFAVQGGVFSEGVDYPGDMLIGAFVIGPPLPNFDLKREEMRNYYQANYEAGFDYAYTYPAMAKAVQAAGRVIRSETDKGLIVLMDNRFIQTSYAKSMPQDWFDESPRELVSESILQDVRSFWESVEPSANPKSGVASVGEVDAAPFDR